MIFTFACRRRQIWRNRGRHWPRKCKPTAQRSCSWRKTCFTGCQIPRCSIDFTNRYSNLTSMSVWSHSIPWKWLSQQECSCPCTLVALKLATRYKTQGLLDCRATCWTTLSSFKCWLPQKRLRQKSRRSWLVQMRPTAKSEWPAKSSDLSPKERHCCTSWLQISQWSTACTRHP